MTFLIAGEETDGEYARPLRSVPDGADALPGFDPVVWTVPTRRELEGWAEHFDR